MKRLVLALLMVLLGSVSAKAQWYQTGSGQGLFNSGNSLDVGYNIAHAQPDCGSTGGLYLCMPQWQEEFDNFTFNGYVGMHPETLVCHQVGSDGRDELDACVHARQSCYYNKFHQYVCNATATVELYHVDRVAFTNNLIYSGSTYAFTNFQSIKMWMYFSENCTHWGQNFVCDTARFDLQYSTDGVTWTSTVSFSYPVSGNVNTGFLVADPNTPCNTTATVHIDGWKVYENTGGVSPNMLDDDYNTQCGLGSLCDADECVYNGQILYEGQ